MPLRFRFGTFTLLSFERKLLSDGQPVALGSRAIDLLLALVRRHGEVVSKKELFESAWPGLVVEDNNLAVQIGALRKLLGPSAIVNIARLGYRFGIPVEELPDDAAPAQPPATNPQASADLLAPLPMPPELMLGRATDSAELDKLLQEHRLVTIVGPAGVGKTALAMAAAQARRNAMRDGAVWIDLAAIRKPTLVPRLLIQALRLPAAGQDDALPALLAPLRRLQVLVVFDNAEHLAEAVAQLACAVMAAAPGMRMLVTSQVALQVTAERVFGLEPLAVPPAECPLDEARTYGAMTLFVDEALRVDRHFVLDERNLAGVIALCRQLDGLPLALKLAAARVPTFGIEGLRTRLADRFGLLRVLAPDVPVRHQTLRAAIDWSHGLLPPDARKVFRRLSVFAGGLSLELAIATVKDESLDDPAIEDALELLAGHSLLAVDPDVPPRYRLLDSMREYARLELESSGESEATHRRHAQAMLALFQTASVDYWRQGDADFLHSYGREIDNVRVALDWCLKNDGPLGVALVGATADLFVVLLMPRELRERLAAYEPWVSPALPPEVFGRYHLELARIGRGWDPRQPRESSILAARIYRELGDTKHLYIALQPIAASLLTPASEARELQQELALLEQPDWPPSLLRQRMASQASVFSRDGDHAAAREAALAALAYSRRTGSERLVAIDLANLAYFHHASGDTSQAVKLGRELMGSRIARNGMHRISALGNLATALLAEGEVTEARERMTEFFDECRDRSWEGFGSFSNQYPFLAAREGRFEAAARLIGYADHAFRHLGPRFPTQAAAREHALRLIEAALDPARLEVLRAEGSTMDQETVVRLTLETGME